ncbi:hypothetical protein FPHYL_441 [Fusarium phyllophilum]|uniref:Uncharacterized protein n=1 Tax=Fusarium phyllophilum TaxID=47803 RepID=A0A8H5NPE3_9HYPO|nr:hypothetical protein FPHYL_441 [Fusarium phyllophilum]
MITRRYRPNDSDIIQTLKTWRSLIFWRSALPYLLWQHRRLPIANFPRRPEAENFFLQTDVGWFDGGDKNWAISGKPSTEKRTPADADAESFVLQTDVGWAFCETAISGETNLCDDNADARPEDYDEDLSDCSTFSCASRNGCEYGTEDICEYHRKLDMEGRDSDNELDSNDPYDVEYLEMKMDRRDRKRELRAQKE